MHPQNKCWVIKTEIRVGSGTQQVVYYAYYYAYYYHVYYCLLLCCGVVRRPYLYQVFTSEDHGLRPRLGDLSKTLCGKYALFISFMSRNFSRARTVSTSVVLEPRKCQLCSPSLLIMLASSDIFDRGMLIQLVLFLHGPLDRSCALSHTRCGSHKILKLSLERCCPRCCRAVV